MRILVFHGYLLRGTGSNVYNLRLAAALARQGHQVHLLCQERRPEDFDVIDAAGDWDAGGLRVRDLRRPGPGVGTVTTYRPALDGVLPVYVADRYEGIEARTFAELDDAAIAEYVARNVSAVREVAQRVSPDVALANHLVMGPLILARALGDAVPYAVKIHGSALEYTVRPEPARFLPAAREGLARARTVLAGSRHTAERLWATMGDPQLPSRTRLGPPGVDGEAFVPQPPDAAARGLACLVARLRSADVPVGPPTAGDAFSRDVAGAARALGRLDPGRDRLVAFVGKLIVSKGVDLLAAAWPLVVDSVPDARLVVVGFGGYRDGLERLVDLLADGDLNGARELARQGRLPEGGPMAPLEHLGAFLSDLETAPDRDAYLAAARRLRDRLVLCGRLEHDELPLLLAACEAQVVPSTFPEAFGMVAVEGAACGALPVVAEHSGLAEVHAALASGVPEAAHPWLSFTVGPGAVRDLAACVIGWLQAPQGVRDATREGLVATAHARFSWDGVARGVIAAALGEHAALAAP